MSGSKRSQSQAWGGRVSVWSPLLALCFASVAAAQVAPPTSAPGPTSGPSAATAPAANPGAPATASAASPAPTPAAPAGSQASAPVPGASPSAGSSPASSTAAPSATAGPVATSPAPAPAPVPTAPIPTSPIPSPSAAAAPREGFNSRTASPGGLSSSQALGSSSPFGNGQLPRTDGQIWRTYDLSDYVDPIRNVAQPEQAALDWILRETGSDVWFGQPFGFLSIDRKAVHVYHTPQMHETVKSVVDRLNASRGESYQVALRVLTVGSPNWRSRAFATLQPVPVQTPGVEAWLLTRENATLLIAELQRRLDVTEFESSVTPVVNGQSLIRDVRRPKQYVKTVAPVPGSPAPYTVVPGAVEEGYQIQISPLISDNGRVVDAAIRCRVDQVEKMIPVPLEVPLPAGGKQTVEVQVPQVSSSQMHERFRWPVDAVLLISGGMGAAPGDGASKNVLGLPTGLLEQVPPRADGLMFIEIQGRVADAPADAPRTAENWNVSGGRY